MACKAVDASGEERLWCAVALQAIADARRDHSARAFLQHESWFLNWLLEVLGIDRDFWRDRALSELERDWAAIDLEIAEREAEAEAGAKVQRRKAYLQAWRAAHREQMRAKAKAWRLAHAEEILARRKIRLEVHGARDRARARAYYRQHKAEIRARQLADYAAHQEHKRAQARAYHRARRAAAKALEAEAGNRPPQPGARQRREVGWDDPAPDRPRCLARLATLLQTKATHGSVGAPPP